MLRVLALAILILAPGSTSDSQATQTPPPRLPGQIAPPPQSTPTPQPTPQPPATATPGQELGAGAPQESVLGTKIYPGAEFIGSYNAGKGNQRYYLYGTNVSYVTVRGFYQTMLKGRELFKMPAMWQFDLPGKFQEDAMAYPPSVVVKDYTWNSEGYLHVVGTESKRFHTVIQIVPATSR